MLKPIISDPRKRDLRLAQRARFTISNKMVKKQYILTPFLAVVWICFLYLPANSAVQNTADSHESLFLLNKIAADTGQHNFIIAQDNRNGEIENESDSTQGEKSGQAGKSDKQPSKPENETDSTQSFEPTEKVKADQAVDFPYDI